MGGTLQFGIDMTMDLGTSHLLACAPFFVKSYHLSSFQHITETIHYEEAATNHDQLRLYYIDNTCTRPFFDAESNGEVRSLQNFAPIDVFLSVLTQLYCAWFDSMLAMNRVEADMNHPCNTNDITYLLCIAKRGP